MSNNNNTIIEENKFEELEALNGIRFKDESIDEALEKERWVNSHHHMNRKGIAKLLGFEESKTGVWLDPDSTQHE